MKSVHGELTPPLTAPKSRKRKRSASLNVDSLAGRPHPQEISAKPLSTSLYDHISHIQLEQDALREFNKRNRRVPRPNPPSPGSQHLSIPQRRQEVSAELQRFARTGGPNLTDLRGYKWPAPDRITASQNSNSKNKVMAQKRKADAEGTEQSGSQQSRKTDATGVYDENFEKCLAERNVKRHSVDTPQPTNHANLLAIMEQNRQGPSDPETLASQWKKFLRAIEPGPGATETDVQARAFTKILGDADYPSNMNKFCTTWAQLFPDIRLTQAKPDFFDGLQPGPEYRLLTQQLDSYVCPAKNSPLMPNFFTEIKGPSGTEKVLNLQALYAGTLGARGVYQAQKVAGKDPFDGNAYLFSGTFISTSLRLYAHFVSQPTEEDGLLHYHMHLLHHYPLDNSAGGFLAGVNAFQNLRDHAAKVRMELAHDTESKLKALEKAGTLPPPLVAPDPL